MGHERGMKMTSSSQNVDDSIISGESLECLFRERQLRNKRFDREILPPDAAVDPIADLVAILTID